MKIFVIALALIAILFAVKFTHSASQFDGNDPLIDQYSLEIQKHRFSFDEQQRLINGPRRGANEPVDYSSLLKRVFIQEAFDFSLTKCPEGVYYCHKQVFKLPKKVVRVKIFHEHSFHQNRWFNRVYDALKETLLPVGFDVIAEADAKKANVILRFGSRQYLERELDRIGDEYGRGAFDHMDQFFQRYQKQYLFGLDFQKPPLCYVYTKEQISHNSTTIFSNDNGIDDCLRSSLFHAIGVPKLFSNIPSITVAGGKFIHPTFADHLIVNLLYQQHFPKELDENSIAEYLAANIVEAWHKLLEQDLEID